MQPESNGFRRALALVSFGQARLIPASNLGDETISELPAKASKQERPGC